MLSYEVAKITFGPPVAMNPRGWGCKQLKLKGDLNNQLE